MKLNAVAVALAVTGFGASVAIAKGPPPAPANADAGRMVKVCHRTGSASTPFRELRVSRSALEAHMRHGDLLGTNGDCLARVGARSSPTTLLAAP